MPTVKTWARAYRSGATYREIAAAFGVNERAVREALAGRVASRRYGPRGRVDVPTEVISDLRDKGGWSWSEIAAHVGMAKSAVQNRYAGGRRGSTQPSRSSTPST